ncbi:MAG: dihydrolipoyllysine-residue succinyltransferase [Phycisphaeraceae bacterium]
MAVDLVVPEVGESITEVEIGKWLVSEGDAVEKDQPLVEIETDKVTLELPAPESGTISKITHKQGTEAAVGDKIGEMDTGKAGAAKTGTKKQEKQEKQAEAEGKKEKKAQAQDEGEGGDERQPEQEAAAATEQGEGEGEEAKQAGQEQSREEEQGGERRIMPAAQRLIDEHDLDASKIEATGPGGRLLKEDVQNHLQQQGGAGEQTQQSQKTTGNGKPAGEEKPSRLPDDAVPPPAFAEPAHEPGDADRQPAHAAAERSEAAGKAPPAPTGERGEEIVPMTPMRRRIAQRLVEAQQTAALLTTFNECDMTEVMSLRSQYKEAFEKKYGIKLGFMSFFVKAVVDALLQYPQVGAEVRDTNIVFKDYIDIGIAVGTGKGLVVPVLRDADQKSFAEIESTIADFGKRAQAGKLALDELQGGTFTITNGGIFGSMLSTPIINPPQSAVLGMHAIQRRPIAVGTPGKDERIEIRPMMNLALSYDHRLIDGREAVTFLKRIKETIEEPTRMLMEV